jgi:hypothetical protein
LYRYNEVKDMALPLATFDMSALFEFLQPVGRVHVELC